MPFSLSGMLLYAQRHQVKIFSPSDNKGGTSAAYSWSSACRTPEGKRYELGGLCVNGNMAFDGWVITHIRLCAHTLAIEFKRIAWIKSTGAMIWLYPNKDILKSVPLWDNLCFLIYRTTCWTMRNQVSTMTASTTGTSLVTSSTSNKLTTTAGLLVRGNFVTATKEYVCLFVFWLVALSAGLHKNYWAWISMKLEWRMDLSTEQTPVTVGDGLIKGCIQACFLTAFTCFLCYFLFIY